MRILIIEDNADIRENTELLGLEGYVTLEAENGVTGLEIVLANLPDLILCDVKMPYKDGHEVLDEIKNNILTKDIPFVFISSSVEPKDVRFALNKGADDYIIQPFGAQELFEVVRCRLSVRNP